MIVDDDAGVRYSLESTLSDNFDLLTANSYQSAISTICGRTKIHALITDLDISGTGAESGLEVAVAFRNKFPKAPIFLMSGNLENDARIITFQKLSLGIFISKPFDTKILLVYLRAI